MDAPAEIRQLDDASRPNQHIFRLDIPVDDVLVMEIVNGTAELRNDIRDQLVTLLAFSAPEES